VFNVHCAKKTELMNTFLCQCSLFYISTVALKSGTSVNETKESIPVTCVAKVHFIQHATGQTVL